MLLEITTYVDMKDVIAFWLAFGLIIFILLIYIGTKLEDLYQWVKKKIYK